MGTDNGIVEQMQKTLRNLFLTNENHKPAFLYGKGTANQRIESWWCHLRKQNAQFWINKFEDLKEEGLSNGTFVDKTSIQFCFLDIIQIELDQVALEWNTHTIRGTKNSRTPVCRPIMMFQIPSLYDAEDKLVAVPQEILNCLNAIFGEKKYLRPGIDDDVLLQLLDADSSDVEGFEDGEENDEFE
ncbi:unnamed protein product [Ceutorhynchus assimilis]|uniref:Integrase core domain-containing protein n=1 Tax=Ceutorhynchus assimilis TaxID=467358 RepID=A0A9N9QRN1_9CUCU|nr:unnamed protein product [Ceutorhynchus assimilis]